MAAAVRGGEVDRGRVPLRQGRRVHRRRVRPSLRRRWASTQSMGRVGSALDNAAAESLNSTLEWELLSRRHFATKDQARREVAGFIDAYNHRRRHSSCEMLPPVAYEQVLAERAAEAARQDRAA